MHTLASAPAKTFAMARPMPDAAPVMMAVLFFREKGILYQLRGRGSCFVITMKRSSSAALLPTKAWQEEAVNNYKFIFFFYFIRQIDTAISFQVLIVSNVIY